MGVEDWSYSQDNTAENFEAQEAQRVIEETRQQLGLLESDVRSAKKSNEIKGWNDEALSKAKDLIGNFYEIKKPSLQDGETWTTKEQVVFNLDAVKSYLENLLKRLSVPGAPKYTEMSNEKIFGATVLAVQILLESINRPQPQIGKYDVGVISGKLDEKTKKTIEDFQRDHKGLDVDGKPGKGTIGAILRELKEQTNGLSIERSTPETPTMIASPQNILTPYFNNEHANERNSPVHEVLGPGVEIIREGRVVSYVVQKNDTTTRIRDKLAQYEEFNYLKAFRKTEDNGRSTMWLNIKNDSLRTMAQTQETVFIPSKIEDRKIEAKNFYEKCKKSIENMKDTKYGNQIQNLINKVGVDNIAKVMTTFAKCESNLGEQGLYRYETAKSYSLSYFHILMSGIGLKAKNNLGFSDADLFDPVNGGMLFLGFRCEWCMARKLDLSNYFNMKRGSEYDCLNKCAHVYNGGSSKYPGRLRKAYDAIKGQL